MRPTKAQDRRLGLLLTLMLVVPAIPCSLSTTVPVHAQGEGPSVAMVSLHTTEQNGKQMVITPKGMVVPLPGGGVNGNVVQIYVGSNGGYWYVDRNGQTVDLTQYANAVKAGQSYGNPVPQYAPMPYQQQPASSSSSSSGGSSGGSAVATAAAAGLGAMAGAAMTNGYYNNVPYGTPMYYGAGNRAYYQGAGGKPVYVDNSTTMNNTANVTATNNQEHYNNLQQQQKWYQQQQQNSDRMKQWQNADNPFVAANAAGDTGGRRGRFGRGGDDGGAGGGGRFGRRGNQDADGAGFDAAAQNQNQGGRFGGRRGADGGGAQGNFQRSGFGNRDAGGNQRGARGGRFGR